MPADSGMNRMMPGAVHSRLPVSAVCFTVELLMRQHLVGHAVGRAPLARALRNLGFLCAISWLCGCEQPYRIGEYVLVEWEEGQPPYPAYIIEQEGKTRFRVHYDGYATRWDEDVTIDRIKGRVTGHVFRPPPPKKVQRAQGITPTNKQGGAQGSASAAPVGQYQVGDRVKVRWRGTVYAATVVGVVGQDKYLIHYDGHESAWDEVVNASRIVSTR